jgi:rhomboid protease GluP
MNDTPDNAPDVESTETPPDPGLRDILFPKRGLSATEALILINILVFAALATLWRADYLPELRWLTDSWWHDVREHGAYAWFLPTIFMHAGFEHLAANLTALLAGAAAVEFLIGPRWTLWTYLATGFGAAAYSYWRHDAPPLSVGASGAIFGLLGCALAFITRRRAMFTYRQSRKVLRVYVPLFVLLFVPALARADVDAHVGGLACGIFLGFILPPHSRISRLAADDPMREEPSSEDSPDPR